MAVLDDDADAIAPLDFVFDESSLMNVVVLVAAVVAVVAVAVTVVVDNTDGTAVDVVVVDVVEVDVDVEGDNFKRGGITNDDDVAVVAVVAVLVEELDVVVVVVVAVVFVVDGFIDVDVAVVVVVVVDVVFFVELAWWANCKRIVFAIVARCNLFATVQSSNRFDTTKQTKNLLRLKSASVVGAPSVKRRFTNSFV